MSQADQALVRAYRLCFSSPAGREVLKDLMQFCHFRVPLAVRDPVDPNDVLLAEGARQVFLRVITIMTLSSEQITSLFGGQQFSMEDDNDAA
jgi:hypothetical protein